MEELGLQFEEVVVSLDAPREPWYLSINPRGVGPALRFIDPVTGREEILTESSIVVNYLADSCPSNLLPASHQDPLFRARLTYFVDTWNSKVSHFIYTMFRADSDHEKEALSKLWVSAVEKEIEPMLKDAAPFFGGRSELTLAEVIIAPFLLRIWTFSNDYILPLSVKAGLQRLPNFARWAEATISRPSVRSIWDEEAVVARTAERIANVHTQVYRRGSHPISNYLDYGPNGSVPVTPA